MSSPNRKLTAVITILVFMIIVLLCAGFLINRDTVIPPHITPVNPAAAIPAPVYTFPFEQSQITLSSPVDSSVYAGATSADKDTYSRGNISDNLLMSDTYLSMINDPHQDAFYADLISALRSVREKEGLNDDQYLELITVFVQSIKYEAITGNPAKFPIGTYVDKSGDCADKSLLLAGILSREGYNVALLSFPPESHMAVGVVCPGADYKNTGYAFVETTQLSFVGVPTETLAGGIPLVSTPVVIPVGNGTKTYGSCGETRYLDSVLQSSEQEVNTLTARIDAMKGQMDRFYQARDVNDYNGDVPLFNTMQNERLQYAEIHNYILDHQFDREGTYEYVKQNLRS
jgi:hypothetical protein